MNLQVSLEEYTDAFKEREKIDQDQHIFVHYRLEPAEGYTLEEAAVGILMTTTLMTLQPLSYESPAARFQNRGYVVSVKDNGEVCLAFPLSMCSQSEGLTHVFAMISFGVEYQYTEGFWVDKIEFPSSFLARYHGPRFGVEGIREEFKVPKRPLVGAIVGPRSGTSLKKVAVVAKECLLGGVDFIADDLRLVDPEGELSFLSRVPILSRIAYEASRETGEVKKYFANITLSPARALKYAEFAKNEGVGGLITNHFSMGYGAIEELVDMAKVPIITASMGDSLLVRDQALGMSSARVMFLMARLAGVDAIHAGTSSSECYGPEAFGPSVIALRSGLLGTIPPCFAVAEGGITIADVWANICSLGPDVLLKACRGIIDYPGGASIGARAFRTLTENLSHLMSQAEAHDKIMEIAGKDLTIREGLERSNYRAILA